jgi:glycosyltransferase involved in cell wall biosynthesis
VAGRHPPGSLGADAEAGVTARGPIRVLHLRDSASVDGPGRTILETASAVDRSRVQLHIGILRAAAQASSPMFDAAQRRGLMVHPIVDRPGLNRALFRQIKSLIDDLQIDILHSSDIRTNLAAALTPVPARVRRVATAHGWIANDFRRKVLRLADKLFFRRFDRVIFVSNATSQLVPRWWLPQDRRVVLYNALSQQWWEKIETPCRSPGSHITLLSVGRLSPEKGHEALLRAIASLRESFPELRLRIAGTGPREAKLRQCAMELGIADRVEFLGYLSELRPLYAGSDLVVQSSLTEGMPNAVLEACAVGVPVVATDVGGTREIILQGDTGWLIAESTPEAISDGIHAFLKDRDRFRAMAKHAREVVRHRHSIAHRTEQLMALYESLVCGGAVR